MGKIWVWWLAGAVTGSLVGTAVGLVLVKWFNG